MGVNIAELKGNIKGQLDRGLADWGLFCVIFLIGVASFGLGRLSAVEDVEAPVTLSQAPTEAAPKALVAGGLIVASKNGTVYYFPWCSGAQKIQPDNTRWFPDEQSALQAGYAPSKVCKGLAGQ